MFPTFLKPSPTRLRASIFCAAAIVLANLANAQPVDQQAADTQQLLVEIRALIKQKQMPKALEKTELYIASKPRDAEGHFMKGMILMEMKHPAEAIAIFAKITEDFPELPEPYNNLAVLYAQQKQYDQARAALEMAIRANPGYAVAYENLGDIYIKMASQAYDKAVQLDTANKTAPAKQTRIKELIVSDLLGGKPSNKP